MRAYATKAWANATLSVYPATVGPDQWIRLDNVMLQRTPATAIVGVECFEPGATPPAPNPGFAGQPGGVAIGHAPTESAGITNDVRSRRASALRNLWNPFGDRLSFDTRLRYWLPPSETAFEVQVSADGETWQTVSVIEPSDHWRLVMVDPRELSELVMYVRVIAG